MKKIYIIFISAIASCALASAQQLNSAYFTEGYKFRHQINPAFASSRNYLSLGIGNVSLATRSNMGISTFLYPVDGQLTTFMNSAVSADEFLGKLRRKNVFGADISENLMSTGVWGKNGFTTVELNVKLSAAVNLPKDLFSFMKNVGQSQSYNISNLGVRARSYMELAVGHSHSITERLNIGAKVKFLVGLIDAEARIDNMRVNMDGEQWRVEANGSLYAAAPGLDVGTKAGSNEIDFNSISLFEFEDGDDVNSIIRQITGGIGYGAAIDLGATYELIDGLTLSAAVVDLGFMTCGNAITAHTDNQQPWMFDGFDNIAINNPDSENSIDNQLNALGEDLQELIRMYKDEGTSRKAEMLTATLNLGAEYKLPFYRKLSAGFLYSNRFSGPYSKYEGRFFVNVHPVKWFEFSTNYGISNHGSSWGAALSLDFPGVGIFLGTDNIFWNVTPPIVEGLAISSVPYNKANVSLNFGLTFNLSKLRHLGDSRD